MVLGVDPVLLVKVPPTPPSDQIALVALPPKEPPKAADIPPRHIDDNALPALAVGNWFTVIVVVFNKLMLELHPFFVKLVMVMPVAPLLAIVAVVNEPVPAVLTVIEAVRPEAVFGAPRL